MFLASLVGTSSFTENLSNAHFEPTLESARSIFLGSILLLTFFSNGCSRSPWMKTDGHEVTPREELECVQQVQEHSKGEVLDQEVREQRIEQCMLDKGYARRPWWSLNDLHWHIKKPTY